MAEIKLTPEQQAVVEHRGSALLVSAAAGSGKTKVLVDRVLRRVAEEQKNIDDFLMITFTQPAAAELRGKLIDRLSEQLSLRPNDRHLQKQMSRVYLAQISTVHAFCGSLLREYAHVLDLPADFRISDEQEAERLRTRAMTQLLEQTYREAQDDEVTECLNILSTGRDDAMLAGLIEKVYRDLQCWQSPERRLDQLRQSLDLSGCEDLGQTVWGAYWLENLQDFIKGAQERMARCCARIAAEEGLAAYEPTFRENCELLARFAAAKTWGEVGAIPFETGRLKAIRACPVPELQEQVKETRKRILADLKEQLALFYLPMAETVGDLQQCGTALRGLLTLCERFSKAYRAEKLSRHVLDYNDMEHEALRLIYGSGTTPTAYAREVSARFAEIMIDEYQDTNAVQDAIFRGISQDGQNLFFVGDVKQSIYRFRMADPTIFLDKYHSYADYQTAAAGAPVRILLSDNFRSQREILSAANAVFRRTMTPRVGGLYYGDAEALHPRRVFPELGSPAVELHYVDMDVLPPYPPVARDEVEAEFVAAHIAQMLCDGTMIPASESELRPVRAEDIVILMRSLSGKAATYLTALRRHGIRCICGSDDLFAAEEIGFLLALLQILDNPHQDIPLLTVLMSPVFGCTAEELAQLRASCRTGDLFDALEQSEAHKPLLETLTLLRQTAREGEMRRLLDETDDRLCLRAIYGAMDGGTQRRRNIEMFFGLADRFEGGDRFGLHEFLQYLTALREKGLSGEAEQTAGAVRLMTMHKSKGLEFPVVFLADLSKQFNIMDSTEPVLVDPVLGIGAACYDPAKRVSYPTIARAAISDRIRKQNMSEELRVLYVAMTRAKYRMVMTCCSHRVERKLRSLVQLLDESACPSENAGAMADWVLMTALTRTEAGELFALGGAPEERAVSEFPWRICVHEAVRPERRRVAADERTEQERVLPLLLPERRHEAAALAPSKLTATQLKGRTLDEESAQETRMPLRFDRPAFDRSALTPTERGTAIHLAMQFVRYENCRDLPGIRAELSRLLERKLLTQQQYEAVDPARLQAFFASSLGRRVLQAPQVVREFKFSVLEDAGLYDPCLAGEQVLLQGVTDCCLLEADGLVLLDFKSDRIRPGQEAARAQTYRGQLDAYGRALSEIFDLPVKERILWFFATDTAYFV